jgi:hypothetical protein
MKQNTIIFLTLSTLLFFACQDVIEIDLNSSKPTVVVEGNITLGKKANLMLSYTTNYFNTEAPKLVENATVTLSNSKGESEQLANIGNGNYVGQKLKGEANTEYELTVKLPDNELKGKASIPSKIELLGVSFKESTMERPNRPGMDVGNASKSYQIQLSFTDDPAQENFYLFKISSRQNQSFFGNTMTTDQLLPKTGVINYSPMMSQFNALDTVSITIYSMDKKTYSFYNQLSDISGGGGFGGGMLGMSTPYNPESNMGYSVLGYFTAWSIIDTTVIVVP